MCIHTDTVVGFYASIPTVEFQLLFGGVTDEKIPCLGYGGNPCTIKYERRSAHCVALLSRLYLDWARTKASASTGFTT